MDVKLGVNSRLTITDSWKNISLQISEEGGAGGFLHLFPFLKSKPESEQTVYLVKWPPLGTYSLVITNGDKWMDDWSGLETGYEIVGKLADLLEITP